MVCEMAEYGRRLSPMFHFRGDPPFEDVYLDHAVFLKALLGEETDAAVEHFRGKLASAGEAAAPVLIDLLVRLGRQEEAIRRLGGISRRTRVSSYARLPVTMRR